MSKKLIYLLRHGSVPRDNDGAIEFWRMKDYLQDHFVHSQHWSDEKWKSTMAKGGGNKKRYQYCTESSGTIVYVRALQGHSGRNLIDPSLQDNVLIPNNFFEYILSCRMCNQFAFYHQFWISTWRSKFEQQTDSILSACGSHGQNHKDPDVIDPIVPRRAQCLHNARKTHQDAAYWVDINLAMKKGLKFHQTRSNAIILQETLPAYCIPKVVRLKTVDVLYEKVYMSPRLPPKISLTHDWMKELGSEVARQTKVEQLSRSFQSNQPTLNPIRARSGRPDSTQDGRKKSRSQEIDVNSFCEELSSSERTRSPVVETEVIQTRSSEYTKDHHVEMAHERTRRLVVETNTENVPDDCQARSCHESETFNVGDKNTS